MSKTKQYEKYLPWLLISLFYFYQYILRVAPGVMVDEMFSTFDIDAEQFASLGVIPTAVYGILQIPLGFMIDRFGLRKVALTSILLCTLSSLSFGMAQQFYLVQLSRLMLGIGSASAFLSAIKAVVERHQPGKRAVLLGATLTLGCCGPLVCSKLLALSLSVATWRSVFYYLTFLGLGLATAVYIWLPASEQTHQEKHGLWRGFLSTITNHRIIMYTVVAAGFYGPLATFSNLWGKAFLQQSYALDSVTSADLAVLPYLGLAAGSVLVPWIAGALKRPNSVILLSSIAASFLMAAAIYTPLSYHTIAIVLLALGVLCGAEMLCFDGALLHAVRNNSGQLAGAMNTINVLIEAALSYIIGVSLDHQWHGLMSPAGGRVYTTLQFQYAFIGLIIVMAVASISAIPLLKTKR